MSGFKELFKSKIQSEFLFCFAERQGETQRPSCDSFHGPRQSVQTVLSDQLHPIRPPAALHRAHQAVPLSGGKISPLLLYDTGQWEEDRFCWYKASRVCLWWKKKGQHVFTPKSKCSCAATYSGAGATCPGVLLWHGESQQGGGGGDHQGMRRRRRRKCSLVKDCIVCSCSSE